MSPFVLKSERAQLNKLVSDHSPPDAKKKKKKKSQVWEIYGSNQDVGFVQRNRHYEVLPERPTFSCTSAFLLPAENRFKTLAVQPRESVALILLEKEPRSTEMPPSLPMLISEIAQPPHRLQDDLGSGSLLPLACSPSSATRLYMVLLDTCLSLLAKAYSPVRMSSASACRV